MTASIQSKAYKWDRQSRSYIPATQRSEKFLKGPVPWWWIEKAASLPGSALAVGLALWRLAGAMKSPTVRLANSEIEALGVGRSAKSRALSELERAALVIVERRAGCLPKVTILGVEGEPRLQ